MRKESLDFARDDDRKMKKSLKNIFKITVLLGVREGYLLVRNLLGIVEHPCLTFGRILKEKDLSQGILLFGIPVALWFAWIIVLLLSRLFIFGSFRFGFWAKASFLASSLAASIIFLTLGYFFLEVWVRKGGIKSE